MNLLAHDKNAAVISVQVDALLQHGFASDNLVILAPLEKREEVKEFTQIHVDIISKKRRVPYTLSKEEKQEVEDALNNQEIVLLTDNPMR